MNQNIISTIGHTPLVRLSNIFPDYEVFAKLENQNPGFSIKDRVGKMMIEEAEKSGELKSGGSIVEPTSGNTGIGLAICAAVKKYKPTLVMPENMSEERIKLLKIWARRHIFQIRF